MNVLKVKHWLQDFDHRPGAEHPPAATRMYTKWLCGRVVLASALSGKSSGEFLQDVTGVPTEFCALVIANIRYNRLDCCESYSDLCQVLRDRRNKFGEVQRALNRAMKDFWKVKLPGLQDLLPALQVESLLLGPNTAMLHVGPGTALKIGNVSTGGVRGVLPETWEGVDKIYSLLS